jgi:hypothetical protein
MNATPLGEESNAGGRVPTVIAEPGRRGVAFSVAGLSDVDADNIVVCTLNLKRRDARYPARVHHAGVERPLTTRSHVLSVFQAPAHRTHLGPRASRLFERRGVHTICRRRHPADLQHRMQRPFHLRKAYGATGRLGAAAMLGAITNHLSLFLPPLTSH